MSSIDKYNQNPNYCLECSKPILHKENQQLSWTKVKKFCNRSCATSFNNKAKPKRQKTFKERFCYKCGTTISLKPENNKGYYKRKYCNECNSNIKTRYLSKDAIYIENRTKGQLFSSRKNWQSARGSIRVHAISVIKSLNYPKICKVCGYYNHVEICHIKAVKDFPDTTLVSEINSPDNLVYLCPNCHWELDSGLMDIAKLGVAPSM